MLLELTVGFETNIKENFDRKAKCYQQLLAELSNKYKFYYVNLSLGAIGTIGKDSLIMTAMGNLDLSKETLYIILNRTISVCIITTYYIFCMCNKEWENPELLNWLKLIQISRVICCTTESITVRVDAVVKSCKCFCLQTKTM